MYKIDTRFCDRDSNDVSRYTYRQYLQAVHYAVFNDDLSSWMTAMNSWDWNEIDQWIEEADMFMDDSSDRMCERFNTYITQFKTW